MKGRTGIRSPEELDRLSDKTWKDFNSGTFLVDRLGTSRYLDPELTLVLIRLRNELLAEIQNLTAVDRMNIEMAILGYRNALRVQSLINSALLETERQLFGQASLESVLGSSEAAEVTRILQEVEQKLFPLLERCQRMMNRALDRLSVANGHRRSGHISGGAGVAVQVNVGGPRE